MRAAEALLVRSLDAQPASATALAKLAAVRFELSPPLSDPAAREQLRLVRLAGELAPASPLVQLRLADLLLKMGRSDEAGPYLRRTVELDPAQSAAAVRLLAERGTEAGQIARALPPHPRVLAALARSYSVQRRQGDYVALIEQAAGDAGWSTPAVLAAYAGACLATGQAERLRQRLDSVGPRDEAPAEAERLLQRSRAWIALGQAPRALEDARAACTLASRSPQQARHLGDVALAAGDAAQALAAYRLALERLARGSGDARQRAELHARIGAAEERRGRGDRAHDAYRTALRLDPLQPQARRRIEDLERLAGVGSGGR
jgi:tetratricopeptide (TPR) repeat protein